MITIFICIFMENSSIKCFVLNEAETCFMLKQLMDFETQKNPSLNSSAWAFRLSIATHIWRPYGDSNPGYRRERAMS